MPEGIADGLSHLAFGQVTRLDCGDDFLEPVEDGLSLARSGGFSQGRAGSLLSQLFFNLIKLSNELHDESCVPFFGFESLMKFSPNVSHATPELDVFVLLLIAGVGAVAIALQGALKVRSEDVCEIARGTIFAPGVAEATGGIVEDPEVAGGAFSAAGLKEAQGCFVSLQVVGGEGFVTNGGDYGFEDLQTSEGPVVESVAWNADTATLEDTLLTVKRQMIGVFANDEVGDEAEAGESAYERSRRSRSENGGLGRFVFTADFDTLDNLANAAGWLIIEEFGDFVPNDFVIIGVGFVLDWELDTFFGLQGVESFDTAVVFSLGLFSFSGVGLLLRCGGFVVGGGFGLFWLFDSLQEKLQLVRIELFAALAVKLSSEGIEFLAQEVVFGLQVGDALVFFVGRFDSLILSCFSQTTNQMVEKCFNLLVHTKVSSLGREGRHHQKEGEGLPG